MFNARKRKGSMKKQGRGTFEHLNRAARKGLAQKVF